MNGHGRGRRVAANRGFRTAQLMTMVRMNLGTVVNGEQRAATAGSQDHSDPGRFRGEAADSPADAGHPPMGVADDEPPSTEPRVFTSDVDGHVVRWRNCVASDTLHAAVNRRWPLRDTTADGTVGDITRPSRRSDHHPWLVIDQVGVIRARCFDANGIDAGWLAEQLRQLGAAGDPRLVHGGYVIFNERVTSGDWRTWRRYTGADPHTTRLHVSFSLSRPGFDNPAPWLFWEEDTVTPQDLRAIVHGLLDTQVPLRGGTGRGGHTTLRQVITRLDRAMVPVRAESNETTEQLDRVSADVAAMRAAIDRLAPNPQPPC